MVTSYQYDAIDQLTQITQGAQTRAFKYDSLGRMTRQKLAEQTATINDSGVYVGAGGGGALWSDSFSYDDRSNLTQRIDARGVKTNFDYLLSGSPDPLNRLRGISFDKTGADTTHGTIHEAADITYAYMTTGDQERIYTASTAGVSTETYAYDVEGRVSDHTMSLTSRASYPMMTSYLYDTANRLTEVRYPAAYGMSGNPRKTVNVTYDQTSRLNDLKVSGVTQMDQIAYNDYGQATSIRIGGGSVNPLTEQYSFDANTGLMTNQKVKRGATSLMDLTYEYNRGASNGSINGTTGNLTHIVNNLDRNKDRVYEYDTLGRLIKSKGGAATGVGGVTANWTQDYAYDRYGNKTTTTKSGITANSAAIPLDGLASQTYTAATNRITNLSHEYDNSGNMTRGAAPDGTLQRFEFDEAERIKVIKTDAGAAIETNTYATSTERLIKETSTDRTYYAWGGSSVLAEFTEAIASSTPNWAKSYIYAGSRLLSTITKNGAAELTEYHHPDRLGTKAVSDTTANTFKEQATLPFGTEIPAETVATSNQRFTSYDRSGATGLDYAVNRTYNSGQSRFTQVDPIGMASTSIGNPQIFNLFAYTQNNPIDFVDPSGLNLCSAEYSSCGTPGNPVYYLDGFEVSAELALSGLAGGWAVPASRGYSGDLGRWADFDDYKNKTDDGFPGTGTIFVPNNLTLNQALARSSHRGNGSADEPSSSGGNSRVKALVEGAAPVARAARFPLLIMSLPLAIAAVPIISGPATILGVGSLTLRPITALPAAVPTGVAVLNNLLSSVSKWDVVNSGSKMQGFVSGNSTQIFQANTRGATRLNPNSFRLADGRVVSLYPSSGGLMTIQVTSGIKVVVRFTP